MFKLPLVISLLALLCSLGGNFAIYRVDQNAVNRVNAEAKVRRALVVKTNQEFCTKIYGQIVLTEEQAKRQTTFTVYKNLLPNDSNTQLRNLVKRNLNQENMTIKRFNPEQCKHLPISKLNKLGP